MVQERSGCDTNDAECDTQSLLGDLITAVLLLLNLGTVVTLSVIYLRTFPFVKRCCCCVRSGGGAPRVHPLRTEGVNGAVGGINDGVVDGAHAGANEERPCAAVVMTVGGGEGGGRNEGTEHTHTAIPSNNGTDMTCPPTLADVKVSAEACSVDTPPPVTGGECLESLLERGQGLEDSVLAELEGKFRATTGTTFETQNNDALAHGSIEDGKKRVYLTVEHHGKRHRYEHKERRMSELPEKAHRKRRGRRAKGRRSKGSSKE